MRSRRKIAIVLVSSLAVIIACNSIVLLLAGMLMPPEKVDGRTIQQWSADMESTDLEDSTRAQQIFLQRLNHSDERERAYALSVLGRAHYPLVGLIGAVVQCRHDSSVLVRESASEATRSLARMMKDDRIRTEWIGCLCSMVAECTDFSACNDLKAVLLILVSYDSDFIPLIGKRLGNSRDCNEKISQAKILDLLIRFEDPKIRKQAEVALATQSTSSANK